MATRLNHVDASPAPPAHPQRQSMRQRGFSIASDKSATSRRSDGREKLSLKESHDEKSTRKLSISTKANPNAAMNELQPIAQQLQPATMGCLRDNKFLDIAGNPITDPDLSNPTRRRTERPLETILSFESAIEREFKKQREANRQSFAQNDSDDSGYFGYPQSRRTSSYWGGGGDYANNGYYTHGNPSRRSQFDAPPTRNKFSARQHSDPTMNRYENGYSVYSTPGYGMTRDTIITGISNGSTGEPWQNSTNPSSDNSSIERIKPDAGEHNNHGYPTPYREPIPEDSHYTYGKPGYRASYVSVAPTTPGALTPGGPPPPPRHAGMGGPVRAPARQIITLGGGGHGNTDGAKRPTISEQPKRKSWLKRTFSKNKA